MEEINNSTDAKKRHKKQIVWQIWVPLIACILIIIFLGVMVILLTTRDVSGDFNTKWSSISVVFLSLPALFAAFVFLIILCGLIYLTSKLLSNAPLIGQKILDFFLKLQDFIQRWSDKAAEPVISIKSKWHGLSKIIRRKSF